VLGPAAVLTYPEIDPVLFQIGPLAVRWYALAYMAGIFGGWWLAKRVTRQPALWGEVTPPKPVDIDDFLIWAALGIILGGRIGYVVFYNPAHFLAHPLDALQLWQGGMSFHGGFAGVVVAMVLFARRRAFSMLTLFDLIALVVPIGLFLGRLANFVNGELWGRVTDVPWAMVFPGAGLLPRHPSQLYEAALEGIVLFALLLVAAYRFRQLWHPGMVAGLFALGYGLARIVSEFFRNPDVQIGYLAGGLTMGMVLSLPMVIAGGALIWWARRRASRLEGARS